MNNIKIQFVCDASKYNDVRDKDIWVDIYKELQILKRTVETKDSKWIENIVEELKKYNKREDIEYLEIKDVLMIKFYRTEIRAGEGKTQEICCKQLNHIPENIKIVLEKFEVKDYYLTCDFTPDGNGEEEFYELFQKN